MWPRRNGCAARPPGDGAARAHRRPYRVKTRKGGLTDPPCGDPAPSCSLTTAFQSRPAAPAVRRSAARTASKNQSLGAAAQSCIPTQPLRLLPSAADPLLQTRSPALLKPMPPAMQHVRIDLKRPCPTDDPPSNLCYAAHLNSLLNGLRDKQMIYFSIRGLSS